MSGHTPWCEIEHKRGRHESPKMKEVLTGAYDKDMADQAKATNPKDQQATTRLDLSLFPPSAVAYGALAFVEGDLKYGGYNWRQMGVLSSVYYAALMRHMDKWWAGEWEDQTTHVPHLANALACIAILIDAVEQDNLNDDRPPAQGTELYDEFQETVAHLQKMFPRRTPRFRDDQRDPAPPVNRDSLSHHREP